MSSQRQPQEPYRITIRLAGADPAAPAEAVTRALREADVALQWNGLSGLNHDRRDPPVEPPAGSEAG